MPDDNAMGQVALHFGFNVSYICCDWVIADVIRLRCIVKQFSIKRMVYILAIPAAFFGGWVSSHTWSVALSPHRLFISDPAFGSYPNEIAYNPKSFRADVKRLVEAADYPTAIALLDAAYIDDQIAHDGGNHYYAIAGYSIELPGTKTNFDGDRDWIMPGTGCVVQSFSWTDRAWRFANAYNYRIDAKKNGE